MSGRALEMTTGNFDATLKNNDIVFIDFWAEWCGPCKAFGPIFEKVAEKNEDVAFAKVDTEAQQELAAQFGIRSIPTLGVFREGVMLYLQPGMVPEEGLDDLVKQVKALNMDDVRKEIAEHEKNHKHEEGHSCSSC
jgi:thioredoxin 1